MCGGGRRWGEIQSILIDRQAWYKIGSTLWHHNFNLDLAGGLMEFGREESERFCSLSNSLGAASLQTGTVIRILVPPLFWQIYPEQRPI